MFNLLVIWLLSEIFAHVAATPVDAVFEAAHPMITQRAELFGRDAPLSLVGYYTTTDSEGNTLIDSYELSGSAATFRGSTLVDWCSDDSSYLSETCPSAYWTSCDGSTLLSEGGSSPCTSTSTCDYDIIYTGSVSDSSSLRWYHCMGRSWMSFYRERPEGVLVGDTTSTSSFSSESTSESSSDSDSSSAESTASPASTGTSLASETASPTTSPTPTSTPSPAPTLEPSKAWIAGVVIGTVGLLAVAAMGFYLWRRRNSHAYGPAPQGLPQTHMQPPQQAYGNGPSPYFQPASPDPGAYDAQAVKYQGNTAYGGYGAQQYGIPPPGVAATQMPQTSPHMPVQMAASMHELPELASPSRH